jgi:hypothetical protein
MGRSPEQYERIPVVCEKPARHGDLCSLLRFQHLPWQTEALQQILGQVSDSPIDLLGCDCTQLRLEGLHQQKKKRHSQHSKYFESSVLVFLIMKCTLGGILLGKIVFISLQDFQT